jgi:NAD(P)-dependent dehydrogenase (short-subunit alcohol dehydrogenase family)
MKNALVTGASRGIGKAIAIALAKNGINVVITYNNNKDKANQVKNEIGNHGVKSIALKLDQSQPEQIIKILEQIEDQFGSVDILINNAGIAQKKAFLELTASDLDNIFATNFRGPFILCQQVLPKMIEKKWGRIINVSSISGHTGGVQQVHYAATKAALINLTRSLARLYSKYNITSNAVAPEWIITDMMEGLLDKKLEKIDFSHIPAGRPSSPDEVVGAVAFLCSEEASYITGQTININGGLFFS